MVKKALAVVDTIKRHLILSILITILLVITLPFGIKQISGEESRNFQIVKLEDTVYEEIVFENSSGLDMIISI